MPRIGKSQDTQPKNSYLNLVVGVLVVIAFGAIIVGLLRVRGVLPQNAANKEAAPTAEQESLPTKHTVIAGEDLWTISEKYYKTGYNWEDIAKANNLANPGTIETGMELTIPVVTPIIPQASEVAMQATPTAMPTEVVVAKETTQVTPVMEVKPVEQPEAITQNSYTVVAGDNLWNIALRAYGDGFRWVDIARANKLANPNLIHPGNQFVIPR